MIVKLQTRSLVVCFFLLLLSVTKHTPSPDDYDETVLFLRARAFPPRARSAAGRRTGGVSFGLRPPRPEATLPPTMNEQGPLFHCGSRVAPVAGREGSWMRQLADATTTVS